MQTTNFYSAAGVFHKVPVPIKKESECRHEMYCSYSFDMMKVPTCFSCGKSMEGEEAKQHVARYQGYIDKANAEAQQEYEKLGHGYFYVKNSDGSYRHESRTKPKKSIWGILHDVFILRK